MKKELKIGERLKFDKRLVEQNIKHGMITKDDYDKAMNDLPDESDNIQYIEVYEEKVQDEMDDDNILTFTSA